nr:hypothetical protein [Tanacetum cinerariifolium]
MGEPWHLTIEADVPLLGELGEMGEPLGAEVDELMVDPMIDELVEPIVEVKEQMVTPAMHMDGDLAMLFVKPPPSTYEVGGSSTAAAEGPSLTLLATVVFVPPFVIEDLCTRMGNLEYGHRLLVKKVITVSNAEVADSIAIGEVGPKVSTVKDQMHIMKS